MEKLYRIKDVKGFIEEVQGNDHIVEIINGRSFFIEERDIKDGNDIYSIKFLGCSNYQDRPCWFTSNEVERFLEEDVSQLDNSEVPVEENQKDESRNYFVMSKDPHRSRYEASDLTTLEEAKEKAVVFSKQGFDVFIARHHLEVEVKTIVNFF